MLFRHLSQSPFSGQTFRVFLSFNLKLERSLMKVTKPFQRADFPRAPLESPRPYRAKIAISTKLNFFPKKYSRKVTKIILNPRRFVLSAISPFKMYLIPDCYRTSNDFQISSKQFFGLPFDFRFQTTPIIFNKIFLSSIFLNFFVKIFSTSFPKFFLNFSWIF